MNAKTKAAIDQAWMLAGDLADPSTGRYAEAKALAHLIAIVEAADKAILGIQSALTHNMSSIGPVMDLNELMNEEE